METELITRETMIYPDLRLLEGIIYSCVRDTSKIMYTLLLTTVIAEGKEDNKGSFFIIYPVKELSARLSKSTVTIGRCLKELENIGLIRREHQGTGRYSRIYVLLPRVESMKD